MGASQRNAAKSLIRQIVAHLLKLRFRPDPTPRAHWAAGTAEFRIQLEDIFKDSPSLRARRAE